MHEKRCSCVFCKKWMRCDRVKKAEEIWNKPPEVRDTLWVEMALNCEEFE